MGNKVNPIGMRLQVNRTWDSRWYADTKDYGDLLLEDLKIREFIKKSVTKRRCPCDNRTSAQESVALQSIRHALVLSSAKKVRTSKVLRKKLATLTD